MHRKRRGTEHACDWVTGTLRSALGVAGCVALLQAGGEIERAVARSGAAHMFGPTDGKKPTMSHRSAFLSRLREHLHGGIHPPHISSASHETFSPFDSSRGRPQSAAGIRN